MHTKQILKIGRKVLVSIAETEHGRYFELIQGAFVKHYTQEEARQLRDVLDRYLKETAYVTQTEHIDHLPEDYVTSLGLTDTAVKEEVSQ